MKNAEHLKQDFLFLGTRTADNIWKINWYTILFQLVEYTLIPNFIKFFEYIKKEPSCLKTVIVQLILYIYIYIYCILYILLLLLLSSILSLLLPLLSMEYFYYQYYYYYYKILLYSSIIIEDGSLKDREICVFVILYNQRSKKYVPCLKKYVEGYTKRSFSKKSTSFFPS